MPSKDMVETNRLLRGVLERPVVQTPGRVVSNGIEKPMSTNDTPTQESNAAELTVLEAAGDCEVSETDEKYAGPFQSTTST